VLRESARWLSEVVLSGARGAFLISLHCRFRLHLDQFADINISTKNQRKTWKKENTYFWFCLGAPRSIRAAASSSLSLLISASLEPICRYQLNKKKRWRLAWEKELLWSIPGVSWWIGAVSSQPACLFPFLIAASKPIWKCYLQVYKTSSKIIKTLTFDLLLPPFDALLALSPRFDRPLPRPDMRRSATGSAGGTGTAVWVGELVRFRPSHLFYFLYFFLLSFGQLAVTPIACFLARKQVKVTKNSKKW
jgi:hypothetical protein